MFKTKLQFWELQLEKTNYIHFFTLRESKPNTNTKFIIELQNLRTEFFSCFSDICSLKNQFRLFSIPFNVDANTIPEKFQMGLNCNAMTN